MENQTWPSQSKLGTTNHQPFSGWVGYETEEKSFGSAKTQTRPGLSCCHSHNSCANNPTPGWFSRKNKTHAFRAAKEGSGSNTHRTRTHSLWLGQRLKPRSDRNHKHGSIPGPNRRL